MSSNRPPLPFGLGRDPACPPHRCNNPDTPLPAPGTPIHDQVASALSHLFQTFFATSLRYLGVSEILDWLEMNGTVDAWILTGLEQGRSPAEVGDKKNLEFGRAAIKSVVRGALEAEDEAWATSLRETGFSSALSMGYEGIVSQVSLLSRHHFEDLTSPCANDTAHSEQVRTTTLSPHSPDSERSRPAQIRSPQIGLSGLSSSNRSFRLSSPLLDPISHSTRSSRRSRMESFFGLASTRSRSVHGVPFDASRNRRRNRHRSQLCSRVSNLPRKHLPTSPAVAVDRRRFRSRIWT